MIRITSKRDGFRRCGVAHGREAAEYDNSRWSAAELAELLAEPMLIVEEVQGRSMTVAELIAALQERGVDCPSGARKADLLALYEQSEQEDPDS